MVFAAACGDATDVATATFRPGTEGVLKVATALPAPGFWDGGTDPAAVDGGYEWELATLLAERFDLELEIVPVPFDRIAAGDLGGADLAISQISITRERMKRLTFSTAYFDTAVGVLAPTGDTIADVKAARERTWAVVEGTVQQAYLDEVVLPTSEPLLVADEVAAAAAIEQGAVDAALVDLPSALVISGRSDRLATVAKFVSDQQYGIALPSKAAHVATNRDAIDAALRGWRSDGTLERLADTWLEPRYEATPDAVPAIPARTPRSTP